MMRVRWLLVALAVWAAGPARAEEPKADFFVAPVGRDDNPGTRERPFATLARARDAVRRLKADSGMTAGVTVLIRDGTYHLTEPVQFGPDDSGTKANPIVYAAYPGEQPIL